MIVGDGASTKSDSQVHDTLTHTLYDTLIIVAGSSAAPCDAAGTIAFIPVGATATESLEGRCLPPHPILDAPSSSCDCPSSQPICVRPSFEEQVLRIRLETPRKDGENVLLWSGDRRAVLDQVRVGKQNPRLLGGVVWWGTMFLE